MGGKIENSQNLLWRTAIGKLQNHMQKIYAKSLCKSHEK